MGTDYRAIEKNHAEGMVPVFDLFKEALPHTEFRPSNEQLCDNPPGIKLRWKGSPFRTVLMAPLVAPENRGYRPSKVLRSGLPLRTDVLDQRRPDGPSSVGEDRLHHAHHK